MSEDYIKREDAISLLQRYIFKHGFYCDTDADKRYTAELVDGLLTPVPAADVVERPRWIPVGERLPKLGEEVLVYYHWINPPEKASITRDSMHIHDISMKPVWGKHRNDKVTHWMPLPEPPKEGK